MSVVPPTLPEFFPARFRVVDVPSAPGHLFCLHLEHGHLLQKADGALHEGYIAHARQHGIASLYRVEDTFGIFHLIVGGHCPREEAREIVTSWARNVAEILGQVTALGLNRAPAAEPA